MPRILDEDNREDVDENDRLGVGMRVIARMNLSLPP